MKLLTLQAHRARTNYFGCSLGNFSSSLTIYIYIRLLVFNFFFLNGRQPPEKNGSSEISSSEVYENLWKTQIKSSELTNVSEFSPMVRVGSSETKLFCYYSQLEVAGLLKSMKVTSHKGQRKGRGTRKERNRLFLPFFDSSETGLVKSFKIVTSQTFELLKLQRLDCKLSSEQARQTPWNKTLLWLIYNA